MQDSGVTSSQAVGDINRFAPSYVFRAENAAEKVVVVRCCNRIFGEGAELLGKSRILHLEVAHRGSQKCLIVTTLVSSELSLDAVRGVQPIIRLFRLEE